MYIYYLLETFAEGMESICISRKTEIRMYYMWKTFTTSYIVYK